MILPERFLFLLYAAFFAIIPLAGLGAIENKKDTSFSWQHLIQDKAFIYKDKKEVIDKSAIERDKAIEEFLDNLFRFLHSKTVQIFLWVLFFIIVAWALYKIFLSKDSRIWSKQSNNISDAAIEQEELAHTDWESARLEAIRQGNQRLAIRYTYMQLLKMLQLQQMIQYRHDKTNYDYYLELPDSYKQPFKKLSRQYEYSWYGNFNIPADTYTLFMEHYAQLKNSIQQR